MGWLNRITLNLCFIPKHLLLIRMCFYSHIYPLCWYNVFIICIVCRCLIHLAWFCIELKFQHEGPMNSRLISIIIVLRMRYENNTLAVFTVPNYIVLI